MISLTWSRAKSRRSRRVNSGLSASTSLLAKTKGSTCFSNFNLLIKVPPITARINPTTTYAMAIRQLKMLARSKTEARSTSGDEIKKENVTPIGRPALVKPMNSGIDEQEQNGVIAPNNEARRYCNPYIFFVFR